MYGRRTRVLGMCMASTDADVKGAVLRGQKIRHEDGEAEGLLSETTAKKFSESSMSVLLRLMPIFSFAQLQLRLRVECRCPSSFIVRWPSPPTRGARTCSLGYHIDGRSAPKDLLHAHE
uniref:Uncharacterized protein n=1 Tax=Lotharella oceanica TaxID=641309 RepID=A0A7S2TG21_9EUKA